jgi:hypothetical protein
VLINALSYLVAGFLQNKVTLLEIGIKEEEAPQSSTPIEVLRKYPFIRRMMISFLIINIIFTPILVMIPWYVENIFKGDGTDMALIEGAMGLGAFLTGIYLSFRSEGVRPEKRVGMIAIVCFFFGLFFQVFSFSSSTAEASILLFLIGILSTYLNVQVLTYFQTSLKDYEIPSIMVVVNIISAASMPLSFAISGLLFPVVEIPQFALICGLLTTLLAFLMPSYLKEKKLIEGNV